MPQQVIIDGLQERIAGLERYVINRQGSNPSDFNSIFEKITGKNI